MRIFDLSLPLLASSVLASLLTLLAHLLGLSTLLSLYFCLCSFTALNLLYCLISMLHILIHFHSWIFLLTCSINKWVFLLPALPHVLHLYPYHATWDSGHSHLICTHTSSFPLLYGEPRSHFLVIHTRRCLICCIWPALRCKLCTICTQLPW